MRMAHAWILLVVLTAGCLSSSVPHEDDTPSSQAPSSRPSPTAGPSGQRFRAFHFETNASLGTVAFRHLLHADHASQCEGTLDWAQRTNSSNRYLVVQARNGEAEIVAGEYSFDIPYVFANHQADTRPTSRALLESLGGGRFAIRNLPFVFEFPEGDFELQYYFPGLNNWVPDFNMGRTLVIDYKCRAPLEERGVQVSREVALMTEADFERGTGAGANSLATVNVDAGFDRNFSAPEVVTYAASRQSVGNLTLNAAGTEHAWALGPEGPQNSYSGAYWTDGPGTYTLRTTRAGLGPFSYLIVAQAGYVPAESFESIEFLAPASWSN